MPSPITWFTVPSYRCTASIIRSSTGSRSFWASSGSRSASNSIEPLRSAKSTVTCLRSPSSAAFEFRMRSARCLGVYVSGEVKRRVVGSADTELDPAGWAHSEQKLAVGESCAPQLTHARARGAAHSSQNFAPGRLSWRHREHFIRTPLATGGRKPGLSSGRTLARASGRVNTDASMRKSSTRPRQVGRVDTRPQQIRRADAVGAWHQSALTKLLEVVRGTVGEFVVGLRPDVTRWG